MKDVMRKLGGVSRTKAPEKKANMRHLAYGFYLVRSQAGFRKALKHYGQGDMPNTASAIWPDSYPAVVSVAIDNTCGARWAITSWMHVNKIMEEIRNE